MHAADADAPAPTRMTGQAVWVVALCAMAVFMDGIDAQVMGYAAPTLRREWALSPNALGAVFSAGLFGMMAGSMVFGIVGDRLGRKRTMLLCVTGLGLFTAFTATATSVESLFAWRFVAGTALGGVGPNAYALTAESTPASRRPLMIMIVATSFPLGGGVGGMVAGPLAVAFDWRAIFIVSGIATLLSVPLLAWRLPGGRAPTPSTAPVATAPAGAGAKRFPLFMLFERGRATLTLLIWILYFCTMLGLYFLSNWLPTLAHEAGVPLQHSVRMMSALQFGGVLGSLVMALLVSRFGAARVLAAAYSVAAVMVVLIGKAGSEEMVIAVAAFLTGASLNGSLIAIISLEADFYPVLMRSTGIGWASAIGRVGAATGPLLGGALLGAGWLRPDVFVAVAGPIAFAAVSAIFFSILLRRFLARRPDSVSAGPAVAGA